MAISKFLTNIVVTTYKFNIAMSFPMQFLGPQENETRYLSRLLSAPNQREGIKDSGEWNTLADRWTQELSISIVIPSGTWTPEIVIPPLGEMRDWAPVVLTEIRRPSLMTAVYTGQFILLYLGTIS